MKTGGQRQYGIIKGKQFPVAVRDILETESEDVKPPCKSGFKRYQTIPIAMTPSASTFY
jgi:hypothetical protein